MSDTTTANPVNPTDQVRRWKREVLDKGMIPDPDSLPGLEPPHVEMPDPDENPHSITDDKLADRIWVYSAWQAFATQAEGICQAAEGQLSQQLATLRSQKYMEFYEKGKTVDYLKHEIEADPDIAELREAHEDMRQRTRRYASFASSYRTMAMTYAGERRARIDNRAYDPAGVPGNSARWKD